MRNDRPKWTEKGKTASKKEKQKRGIDELNSEPLEKPLEAANSKRAALKNISNKKIPEKTKSKIKSKIKSPGDYACIVSASPNTKEKVEESISKGKLSGMYLGNQLQIIEQTPGGGAKKVVTKTPRERALSRTHHHNMERSFADGSIANCQVTLFSLEARGKRAHAVPEALMAAPLDEIEFGPFTINRADLEKIPDRKTVADQNSVKGGPVEKSIERYLRQLPEEYQDFIETLREANYHWSHILGFLIIAGNTNPQVRGNLFAGTDKSNWSKKHYEVALRDLLAKNPNVEAITIWGAAKLLPNSELAVNETLNYKIHCKNQHAIADQFRFNTLLSQTESSVGSLVWTNAAETLISVDQKTAVRMLKF